MPQLRRRVLLLVLAGLTAACGARRPDFSVDRARDELAGAFGIAAEEVSLLSDGPAPENREEWWLDFKVPSLRETLQGRFVGRDAEWVLEGVRKRPGRGVEADWEDVGAMLGQVRAEAAQHSAETVETMLELASAIEAYAVDAGNEFPTTDLAGLSRLLTRGRHLERWQHGEDGWGNRLHYYGSQAGDAYILISRGADNRFDAPLDSYQTKTDAGDFTYEGPNSDPGRDLIYATGSFVQQFVPGE